MSYTIQHKTYRFWDWDAIFPGETVADAFMAAGGRVQMDSGEVVVSGLSYNEAMRIAQSYQADYLGPVKWDNPVPDDLIDVTSTSRSVVPYLELI